jgi:type IV pilus assembly protein PilW
MKRRSHGFSLIELMVGLTLGMILIAGLVVVFSNASRNFRQDEQASRLHDDLRMAYALMSEDVEMAGYWAEQLNPLNNILVDCNVFGTAAFSRLVTTNSCDPSLAAGTPVTNTRMRWVYFNRAPIAFANNFVAGNESTTMLTSQVTSDATISLTDLGFAAGEVAPSSDVIAIKRLVGARIQEDPVPNALEASHLNRVFMRQGGAPTATLFRFTAVGTDAVPPPNPAVPRSDYEYRVAIYYVRTFSVTAGDNIPALCRKILQAGNPPTSFTTECLSQGIENLQVEYGIDTSADAVVDQYMSAPTQAQLARAIALRVSLLGRNQPDAGRGGLDYTYQNSKTYTFGDIVVNGNNDPYYRKLMQGVLLLRNPMALQVL